MTQPPRTLYITDLDGTLLTPEQTLSQYTVDTINDLVSRGMIFSYATARSIHTAAKVTAGIAPRIPVILFNGVFIMESGTGRRLASNLFTPEERGEILDTLLSHEVYPLVYSLVDNQEKFSYVPEQLNPGSRYMVDSRWEDIRRRPVDIEHLGDGEIYYFNGIDTPEKLLPLYEHFRERFPCVYHNDIYSGAQWLDIMPRGATKAAAIRQLKAMLGVERIVAFGDGRNDLSMFALADECYAVENAHPDLKAAATAVIGSNREDGVARWLREHWQP